MTAWLRKRGQKVASPRVLPESVSGKAPIRHSTTPRYVHTRRERHIHMPKGEIYSNALAVTYVRVLGFELDANAYNELRHHTKATERVQRGLPQTFH